MTLLAKNGLIQGDRIRQIKTGKEATVIQWRNWKDGECYVMVDGASGLFPYTLSLNNVHHDKIEYIGHIEQPTDSKPYCKWWGWDYGVASQSTGI